MHIRSMAALLIALPMVAQKPQPLHFDVPLRDKNFYALVLLERDSGARSALLGDPALAAIAAAKRAALAAAAKPCDPMPVCTVAALRWSPDEIERAAGALRQLYVSQAAVRAVVDRPLRDSGVAIRQHSLTGDALLAKVWRDAATGINGIYDVYTAGKPPRYAAIDSPTFELTGPAYKRLLPILATVVAERTQEIEPFFGPSLEFAIGLLDINHRDEAARFEPMERGENRAALARIPKIDWARYPYTAIVVPGAGNDRPGIPLSAAGKLRVEIAARRYRAGKAPLILVSGGFVHPNQTPYAEAIEMKKSLVADFGIPENAILVDPHARHTTTNLRNAARILYRGGVPLDRKALISTDGSQSTYIEAPGFAKRCQEEMGYLPHQDLKRISLFDLECRFRVESLQIDPVEPLDP